MKETKKLKGDITSTLSPRTGRMFPGRALSAGLWVYRNGGSLRALRTRPSRQWHPAHGTCRTCLQFVFIFRHICTCCLKNASPHKTRAIYPEFL